ncbi:signal-regulatory protein beta-2-like isoform X2 [Prinia subflava]|uniref:signal-regulatory protein beta-2-like isoform X2 n=1 Tax=Prinia subflava TaxID=208062 RepID=UPI002FE057DC
MPGGSAGPRPPRADTKALITGSPTFPVPLPLFLRKVWEEPMAAAAAPLLSGQRSPVQRQLLGVGAPAGQSFSLQQPQTKVSVAVGEMLTLRCTTSPRAAPGPVRWLKGWGSGNKTIYDQKIKDPRVTRAVNGSDTDFTIRIRNVQPEDTGTYYCVKFVKSDSGVDEVSQYGSGTDVSVYETALVPGTVAAAVVLCFLLLLLVLFIALCMYRRKRQGGVGSPRTVATGSFLSVPLQCCAGTPGTPSEVLDAESSHLPSQSSKEENNIHYADLQPLPPAPRRGRSPGTAPTEYASLRVAAK